MNEIDFWKQNWALIGGIGLLFYGYQFSQPTAYEVELGGAKAALERQLELEQVAHELRVQQVKQDAQAATQLQGMGCIGLVNRQDEPVNIHVGLQVDGRYGGQVADGTIVCDPWGTTGVVTNGYVTATFFNSDQLNMQEDPNNEHQDLPTIGAETTGATVILTPR